MKTIFTTIFLAIMVFGAKAQDPHLSQFYMAPVYLNPALTGAFDGNYRLTGLFRSQWGSALKNETVPMYRTYTFSAEFRTNKGFSKGDAFGFGVSFLGDQAGEAKLGYNVAGISVAYHKVLDSHYRNYLVAGFSSQLYQQTLNYSNLQFGNQWDGGGYNSLVSEQQPDTKLRYWDINAGLLWYISNIGKTRRTNAYLGVSAFHLNAPQISVFGNQDVRLNRKYVVHGGMCLPLIGRFDLQPKFIIMTQGQSVETIWASDIRILLGNSSAETNNFHLGAMFRMVGGDPQTTSDKRLTPESVVLTAGTDWKGLNISVAYDITVSKLITATHAKGGFEVGLNYTGKWNKRSSQSINCPKF